MARITFRDLRHSYLPKPQSDADFALKRLTLEWQDGGAYALLGPSGCGKTTLLNLISGLLTPTEGQIFFGDTDVTHLSPEQRNIAQVFQFPVIYDTMTVGGNLAFPLRNRHVPESEIKQRVTEIAAMLDLLPMLDRRAAGLTADGKQKISLGRGLVRSDVNVVMFDEPLTVIDPHLKWQLRSKLKELHQRISRTMIYVTHDQTEALTFADQVVVMKDGEIVQQGTPVDLFERPKHTFVGHFIGSPGMNLLKADMKGGRISIGGVTVAADHAKGLTLRDGTWELGVRPEFVSFSAKGLPVTVMRVADAGRHRIVETRAGDQIIRLLVSEHSDIPQGQAFVRFDPARTYLYDKGWMAGEQT